MNFSSLFHTRTLPFGYFVSLSLSQSVFLSWILLLSLSTSQFFMSMSLYLSICLSCFLLRLPVYLRESVSPCSRGTQRNTTEKKCWERHNALKRKK
jgi:hypothetical protein